MKISRLLPFFVYIFLIASCMKQSSSQPVTANNEMITAEAAYTDPPALSVIVDITSAPLSEASTDAPLFTPEPTSTPAPTPTPEPTNTPVPTPDGLIGGRYDVFYNGEGYIKTENQYISNTVSITVTKYDSSPLTRHLVYYVADIYIQDIESIRTGSWDESFGIRAINGKVYTSFLKMARRENAITAITGDYYTYNIYTGLVIRNGQLYLSKEYKPWKGHEILFLYKDGSMATIPSETFDLDSIEIDKIWQAWEFGPSLLNFDGTAKSSFSNEYSSINRQNPRTILGYYEPGHYCFVTVDGRKSGYSNGLTLGESATLMESLGCTLAFNLDGGQTSQFYWNDKVYNTPYNGGRFTSDIIYIIDINSDSFKAE